jgi:biopolymer transport protein ExbB/TolQ
MVWFTVWAVLVLGTIVGAVLLGLRLWRQGKAVLAQLQETEQVMQRLQTRIEELEAARGPEPAFTPALLATEEQRQHWRAVRQANRDTRAARRAVRRGLAYQRWDAVLRTPDRS